MFLREIPRRPISHLLHLMSGSRRFPSTLPSIHGLQVTTRAYSSSDGIFKMMSDIQALDLASSTDDSDASLLKAVYDLVARLEVSYDRREMTLTSWLLASDQRRLCITNDQLVYGVTCIYEV